MNISMKIIITDTNIITDLNNAGILDRFTSLENVYVLDLVKYNEFNSKTGDKKIIDNFKTISLNPNEIIEIEKIINQTHGLSEFDIANFIAARNNNAILATGDKKLKDYAEKHGIETIRTLKIINLMILNKIITKREGIIALRKLMNNNKTRIPINEIENLINQL